MFTKVSVIKKYKMLLSNLNRYEYHNVKKTWLQMNQKQKVTNKLWSRKTCDCLTWILDFIILLMSRSIWTTLRLLFITLHYIIFCKCCIFKLNVRVSEIMKISIILWKVFRVHFLKKSLLRLSILIKTIFFFLKGCKYSYLNNTQPLKTGR